MSFFKYFLIVFITSFVANVSFGDEEFDRIVKWRAVEHAVSYSVKVSKNPDLSDATTFTTSEPKLDVSLMKAGKYYFQVVAHDKLEKSSQPSNISTFSIDTDPAELLSPKNGSEVILKTPDQQLNFIWSDALGLDSQLIQIASDSKFENKLIESNSKTNQFSWTPATKNAIYYWRIVSSNGDQYRLRSTTYKIKVSLPALPSKIAFTSEISGGRFYVKSLDDTTHKIQTTAYSFAKEYQWTLSRDEKFSAEGFVATTTTKDPEWQYKFQLGTYFAKVTVTDIFGRQMTSQPLRFIVKEKPVPPPVAGGGELEFESPSVNTPVEFKWTASKDVKSYIVQISKTEDFSKAKRQEVMTNFFRSNLPNGLYYMRVMTNFADGDKSPWSPTTAVMVKRLVQWSPHSLATIGYNLALESHLHKTRQMKGTAGGILPFGFFSSIEHEFTPRGTIAFKVDLAAGSFSAKNVGVKNPNQKALTIYKLDSEIFGRYMILERRRRKDLNVFAEFGIKYSRDPRFSIVPETEIAEPGKTAYGATVIANNIQHVGFELAAGTSYQPSFKSEIRLRGAMAYQTSVERALASSGIKYGANLAYYYQSQTALFYLGEFSANQFNQIISTNLDAGRTNIVEYALKFGVGTTW